MVEISFIFKYYRFIMFLKKLINKGKTNLKKWEKYTSLFVAATVLYLRAKLLGVQNLLEVISDNLLKTFNF